MILSKLLVQNLRTHSKYEINLQSSVSLIVGKNGSGKTTLLESIYIALRGKSFKTADAQIVKDGKDWYRIDIETDRGSRTVKFNQGMKTFDIDGKIHRRLTDSVKYPVVLFEPDDMRIIGGSPTRRRDYIDRLASQCDTRYALSLRRYERALMQRNKLLKSGRFDRDQLFVWDVALSQYGNTIIETRRRLIDEIDARMIDVYRTISPTEDDVTIRYSYQSHTSPQRILTELEHSFERDQVLGTTSVGPHRHDLKFEFNDHPAGEVGSRGELRTITLALKFIEADLLEKYTGEKPIILLDDVFSELDELRQQRLLGEFHDHQVVMTSVAPTIKNIGHVINLDK